MIYGIPPKRVPYGIDIDSYREELLESSKNFGNQELLVVTTTGEVSGCITGSLLARLYLKPEKVCRLTWQHYEKINTAYKNKLTRNKISKLVIRKKRSLFVLKEETKRGMFANSVYFKNIESEINEKLILEMIHKRSESNYPNLIGYTI